MTMTSHHIIRSFVSLCCQMALWRHRRRRTQWLKVDAAASASDDVSPMLSNPNHRSSAATAASSPVRERMRTLALVVVAAAAAAVAAAAVTIWIHPGNGNSSSLCVRPSVCLLKAGQNAG